LPDMAADSGCAGWFRRLRRLIEAALGYQAAQPATGAVDPDPRGAGAQSQRDADGPGVAEPFPGDKRQHLAVGRRQPVESRSDGPAKYHAIGSVRYVARLAGGGQARREPGPTAGGPELIADRVARDRVQPRQQLGAGRPPV